MSRTFRARFAVGAAVAGMTMLASVFVTAGTSAAYDDVGVSGITVNTNACSVTNEFLIRPIAASLRWRDGYCYNPDWVDGTWWKPDSGGLGAKVVLHGDGSADWLGKIEWHPYGEHLWIYDLRNDGDTFYVTLSVVGADFYETFRAPGTGDSVDIGHYNLSFEEGLEVFFVIHDDPDRDDLIVAGRVGTT